MARRDRGGATPTERPTPKRLREARRRGEVARSPTLSAAVALGAGALALLWFAPAVGRALARFTRDALRAAPHLTVEQAPQLARGALDVLVFAVLPVLIAVVVGALLIGYLQVGGRWTWRPLAPRWDRVGALRGLARLFGGRRFVDALTRLVAVAAVLLVCALTLEVALPGLLRLTGASPAAIAQAMGTSAERLVLHGLVVLLLAGAFDLWLQRRRHREDQKMTRREVVRERREREGDPARKAERQRRHREIAQHDMVESVRRADLVVVDAGRTAVALRYDPAADLAPRLVAAGERLVAQGITEVARAGRVPLFADAALARRLAALPLGRPIPEDCYEPVAELLGQRPAAP